MGITWEFVENVKSQATPQTWNQSPHSTKSPDDLHEQTQSLKTPDPIDLTKSNSTGSEDISLLTVI